MSITYMIICLNKYLLQSFLLKYWAIINVLCINFEITQWVYNKTMFFNDHFQIFLKTHSNQDTIKNR